MADSPLGVRVVSVDDASQAYLADLRPDDLIVRVDHREVASIEQFAALSTEIKGRVRSVSVLVFRNGAPRDITVHLYSYPIMQTWGLEFIPEYDLRFAQPQIGLDYWRRLGRGFEEAHQPADALNAYLNGLHHVPTDVDTAVKVAELFTEVSQQQLENRSLSDGFSSLQQALILMERLFDERLTEEQLETIRLQLHDVLAALQRVSKSA